MSRTSLGLVVKVCTARGVLPACRPAGRGWGGTRVARPGGSTGHTAAATGLSRSQLLFTAAATGLSRSQLLFTAATTGLSRSQLLFTAAATGLSGSQLLFTAATTRLSGSHVPSQAGPCPPHRDTRGRVRVVGRGKAPTPGSTHLQEVGGTLHEPSLLGTFSEPSPRTSKKSAEPCTNLLF